MRDEVRQYGPRREPAINPRPRGSPYTAPGKPVDLARSYEGESYYDEPPIKPGHYGWLITAYFFVGGLASAAQFIASIADLVGGDRDRGIVRAGRYIALLGALASPVLLIADLQTPKRWFNMLRIYRGTSAMSIGAWALSGFGAFSGLTAAAQMLDDMGLAFAGGLGRLFQLPAAVAGGVVALYTGTLMAATNLPLASSAFPLLSSLFASSAASTAAAALSLAGEASGMSAASRRSLNLVATFAGISELVFALLVRGHWRRDGLPETIDDERLAPAYDLGVLGMGIGAPLVVHAYGAVSGRRLGLLTILADVSALIGGFILRAVFVFGSNASAREPAAYFRLTEPPGELRDDSRRGQAA